MRPVNRTYAPLQALADELARRGMTHAVTCPGSRNAPLIYALAETDGIEVRSEAEIRTEIAKEEVAFLPRPDSPNMGELHDVPHL